MAEQVPRPGWCARNEVVFSRSVVLQERLCARRGRKRFRSASELCECVRSRNCRRNSGHRDFSGFRHYEKVCPDRRVLGVLAAGQGAGCQTGGWLRVAVMFAVHRRWARHGVIRLIPMTVSGAHTASAAVVRLQGSGPNRSPQQNNCEQAQTCSHFLSRSDRKVVQSLHVEIFKGTPTRNHRAI